MTANRNPTPPLRGRYQGTEARAAAPATEAHIARYVAPFEVCYPQPRYRTLSFTVAVLREMTKREREAGADRGEAGN